MRARRWTNARARCAHIRGLFFSLGQLNNDAACRARHLLARAPRLVRASPPQRAAGGQQAGSRFSGWQRRPAGPPVAQWRAAAVRRALSRALAVSAWQRSQGEPIKQNRAVCVCIRHGWPRQCHLPPRCHWALRPPATLARRKFWTRDVLTSSVRARHCARGHHAHCPPAGAGADAQQIYKKAGMLVVPRSRSTRALPCCPSPS